MRKWASNEASIINNPPEHLRENVEAFKIGMEDHFIKTLGIAWLPLQDIFVFKVKHLDTEPESAKGETKKEMARNREKKKFPMKIVEEEAEDAKPLTKRAIVADIAKIFDPLGFLGPVTIRLKICLQAV
jgi:hypothetical protein